MLQLTQIVIFMEVSMQCGVAKLSSLKNCKVVIFVFVWLVFYQILANSSKILGSMIFLDLSLGTLKSYLMWLIAIEFSEKKKQHMWILKIWQNWFGSVPIWYMNFPFFIFQWNLNRPMSLRMALSLFKFWDIYTYFANLKTLYFEIEILGDFEVGILQKL